MLPIILQLHLLTGLLDAGLGTVSTVQCNWQRNGEALGLRLNESCHYSTH